jgi:hypothetical protein
LRNKLLKLIGEIDISPYIEISDISPTLLVIIGLIASLVLKRHLKLLQTTVGDYGMLQRVATTRDIVISVTCATNH